VIFLLSFFQTFFAKVKKETFEFKLQKKFYFEVPKFCKVPLNFFGGGPGGLFAFLGRIFNPNVG